jgi:hypothetical protein
MTNWNTIGNHMLGRDKNHLLIRFVAASWLYSPIATIYLENLILEPLYRQLHFIDFSAVVAVFLLQVAS